MKNSEVTDVMNSLHNWLNIVNFEHNPSIEVKLSQVDSNENDIYKKNKLTNKIEKDMEYGHFMEDKPEGTMYKNTFVFRTFLNNKQIERNDVENGNFYFTIFVNLEACTIRILLKYLDISIKMDNTILNKSTSLYIRRVILNILNTRNV